MNESRLVSKKEKRNLKVAAEVEAEVYSDEAEAGSIYSVESELRSVEELLAEAEQIASGLTTKTTSPMPAPLPTPPEVQIK